MKLTDEQIKIFKVGKKHQGKYIYDLFDTIEALQQENEQLRCELGEWKYETQCHMDIVTEKCKEVESLQERLTDLSGEIEQLQAQTARMREALEIANNKIKIEQTISGETGMIYVPLMSFGEIKKIQEALSGTPTTNHNPADVEALKQAREVLKALNQADWCDCDHCKGVREALGVIDKIGGGEDV